MAVLDEGSLSRAAKQRFLTQSAFTRRIRLIEENVGAPLFDRSKKPVELLPGVRDLEREMRELALSLKLLRSELYRQGQKHSGKVSLACLHALTTSMVPRLTQSLIKDFGLTTRVFSASREECDLMLMTKRVDYALVYQTVAETGADGSELIETVELASDPLMPVASAGHFTDLRSVLQESELPVIAYPGRVFLGKILETDIFPYVSPDLSLFRVAETELTHAALQFCRTGMGIAWIPRSLCSEGLGNGDLLDLSTVLPKVDLRFAAQRLIRSEPDQDPGIWRKIVNFSYGP